MKVLTLSPLFNVYVIFLKKKKTTLPNMTFQFSRFSPSPVHERFPSPPQAFLFPQPLTNSPFSNPPNVWLRPLGRRKLKSPLQGNTHTPNKKTFFYGGGGKNPTHLNDIFYRTFERVFFLCLYMR